MIVVHMVGNAHIDPVWLWGWQSGVDEALATVSSAVDRCDEYPDFIFARGEAWVYEQVERLRPDLFARIGKLVNQGRWSVVGGTYIQPDLNLPTEVGLRRQFRRGQAYFRDRFGLTPRVGCNVDSFGHPAFLPDLLAEHGCVGYVVRRPEPHQFAIPFNSFRWQGAGGAEVMGFRAIPGYAAAFTELYGQIMVAVDNADPALGHTMCFYGIGNHGGGPTKGQIDWIIEHRHAFPGIELRFSCPETFFDTIASKRDMLPVVRGELQHTFPGCYSAMSDVKRAQRHGEQLMDQAERIVSLCAGSEAEKSGYLGRLERAWDDLLLTEFHDIVTGTSIPSAWPSCRAMQGRARIAAEEVVVEATRRWSYRSLPRVNEHQIVAINSDDQPYRGLVEHEPWLDFDIWHKRWISDLDGHPLPVQAVQPEAMQLVPRILFPAEIAAGSAGHFLVRSDARPDVATETDLTVSPDHIGNGHVLLRLGPNGISGLTFAGRELLGNEGIGLQLRKDSTDTWTFHADRWAEAVETTLSAGVWVVEETGPLRARVHLESRLGTSRVRWTISVVRGEPRVFFRLEVNFDEKFRLLQFPFRMARMARRRTDGVLGGAVERALSPVEWPVLGWSRLTYDDCEVALVTNDAYSLSVDAGQWQWTLMRSPRMAWGGGLPAVYHHHDWHTDQGTHDMAFELYLGTALPDDVLHRATRRQAQPLITFDRYEGMNRPSFGPVPPKGIWTAAMHRNIADGRLPEPPDDGNIAAALWATSAASKIGKD